MRMEPDGPWRVTGSNAPMEADYAQRVLEQTGDIAAAAGGHFGNSPAVGTALDSCRFLRKPTTSKVTRSLNALLEAAERSILSALSSLDEVDATADSNYDALCEIACSKQPRLSQTILNTDQTALRVCLEDGHDLEKRDTIARLFNRAKTRCPRKVWISIPCSAWTTPQNANQRTDQQRTRLEKRCVRARRLAHNVVDLVEGLLEINPSLDVHWEWPRSCTG